jgi:ABC-type Mn2+/Zn2+ transport system ATPase subunit
MSEFVRKITFRGIDHAADMPILKMENVVMVLNSHGMNTAQTRQIVLQDLSFQLEVGEQVAIVGPNGAGKSTLLKLIAGTLKPTKGQIHLFGHDPKTHICIAYVPQRSQIDWTFPATVTDVVMMGRIGQIGLFRRPRKKDWETVQACLQRVNATHLAKKQIGELSGGQQQRVFIARALAQNAELILLDEPFTGLDVPSQEKIFAILDNLRPERVTIMVATHDLKMAAERFDRLMLLNREIIAFDKGETVLSSNNLIAAFGEQLHQVSTAGDVVIADNCCDIDAHDPG